MDDTDIAESSEGVEVEDTHEGTSPTYSDEGTGTEFRRSSNTMSEFDDPEDPDGPVDALSTLATDVESGLEDVRRSIPERFPGLVAPIVLTWAPGIQSSMGGLTMLGAGRDNSFGGLFS